MYEWARSYITPLLFCEGIIGKPRNITKEHYYKINAIEGIEIENSQRKLSACSRKCQRKMIGGSSLGVLKIYNKRKCSLYKDQRLLKET